MSEHTHHRVVVGVDGSAGSREAVVFAAEEARARGVPLHLVCGDVNPIMLPPPFSIPYPLDAPQLGESDPRLPRVLTEIAADVRRRYPGLEVVEHLIAGYPAAVLVEESEQAGLVVVGDRGHGGFVQLLAGSVTTQVATHAHCPVVVVRGTSDPAGPVVVGVDGSAQSQQVLTFAFTEANWRGVPLRAVYAWTREVNEYTADVTERQKAERMLAESLAGWGEKYPQVTVERTPVEADPVTALVDASAGASLIVVGSHGHGTFTSLLLGSVSYKLAHHARCPVAIVRPTG